jgi:hypothetical protein
MEAASIPHPVPEDSSDATRDGTELFRYSAWVHAGRGAAECEHAQDGACQDSRHFHAWVRLPNQFQHEDIRERALAAKARRIRQLRDPQTDAYVILEAELDEARRDRGAMIEELVAKDWWKRHLEALGDVNERDEYQHIDRDRERQAELAAMAPDERPADELAELERHLEAYDRAVTARRAELDQPVREAVEQLDDDQLIEQLRDERINVDGGQVFMADYSRWEWFAGTFATDSPAGPRRFDAMEQLVDAAPEVIDAVRQTFNDLEGALRRGPQGN